MRLVTPEEMQQMDARTIGSIGIPGIVLMERAALGAVDTLLDHFELVRERVGILCGTGNNGGDGLVMARMLEHIGVETIVVHLGGEDAFRGDAGIAFEVARNLGLELVDASSLDGPALEELLRELPTCDLWCDALLGTGIDRDVEGPYAVAVDFLASQEALLAVDIPSGLHGATGAIMGTCAPADVTVTFGLPKLGQALYPGRDMVGELIVVDIGIPADVEVAVGSTAIGLAAEDMGLFVRPSSMHKGDAGRIICIGGSAGKTGAILMTAQAAISSGAGLVVVGTDSASAPYIAPALNEAMSEVLVGADNDTIADWLHGWADVVAIGPGLGTNDAAVSVVKSALQASRAVFDADALNILATLDGTPHNAILTPHPGEAARLLGCTTEEIVKDTVEAARKLAQRFESVVCLKTAATVVAAPDGRLAINMTGNPGMASAGMGDCLTGILSATLAEIDDIFDAACLGVCIHGYAADLALERTGVRGLTVSRLLETLPEAWRNVERA